MAAQSSKDFIKVVTFGEQLKIPYHTIARLHCEGTKQ